MDISRRTFLAMSAAAGAALPLGRLDELVAAPAPAKSVPICVFTKPLQWMDYETVAATAAETGFDGLDIAVRPGGHVLPERVTTDLPRAVEAAKRAGLVVPMITTEILEPGSPHAEEILKTANALGIGYYRMGWYAYGDDHDPAGRIEELDFDDAPAGRIACCGQGGKCTLVALGICGTCLHCRVRSACTACREAERSYPHAQPPDPPHPAWIRMVHRRPPCSQRMN